MCKDSSIPLFPSFLQQSLKPRQLAWIFGVALSSKGVYEAGLRWLPLQLALHLLLNEPRSIT